MTDFRTSQTFVGVLGDWDPTIRTSVLYVEYFADQDPTLRISTHHVEYWADFDPFLRVTQYRLEALFSKGAAPPVTVDHFQGAHVDLFPVYVPVQYGERWVHS